MVSGKQIICTKSTEIGLCFHMVYKLLLKKKLGKTVWLIFLYKINPLFMTYESSAIITPVNWVRETVGNGDDWKRLAQATFELHETLPIGSISNSLPSSLYTTLLKSHWNYDTQRQMYIIFVRMDIDIHMYQDFERKQALFSGNP